MLLYAGAHGPAVTTMLIQSFGTVAEEGGQRLEPVDVARVPQDTRGLAVFYTTSDWCLPDTCTGS